MMQTYPLLATVLLFPSLLSAAEFAGAEAVLKRVQEAVAAGAPKKEPGPVAKLAEQIKAFQKESAGLSDAQAAERWLALLDGFLLIPPRLLYQSDGSERVDINMLLTALPPSSSWDALAAAIAKRPQDKAPLRQGALLILAASLKDDAAAVQKTLADFKALIETDKKLESHHKEYMQQALERVVVEIQKRTADGASRLAAFGKLLEEQEKNKEKGYNSLLIPDLLEDGDEAVAIPLIKRALAVDTEIDVAGKRTRKLVARLALENIDTLKKPLWGLVESEAELPLYEALKKKFPNDSHRDRRNAETLHLLHLIATGKTEAATQKILETDKSRISLSISAIDMMEKQGFGEQMQAFLAQILEKKPELPAWDVFITLSARQGETKQAREMLQKAVAKPGLKPGDKAKIESHLIKALLADDQVEAGLKRLQEQVQQHAAPKPAAKGSGDEKDAMAKAGVELSEEQARLLEAMSQQEESPEEKLMTQAAQLVELGRLLKRDDLVTQGTTALLAAYGRLPEEDYSRHYRLQNILPLLHATGHDVEAESLLTQELTRAVRPGDSRRSMGPSSQSRSYLNALCWLYDKAGRSADVVYLLENSPYWGAGDLSLLVDESFKEPLLIIAARALAKVGRKDDARRVALRALPNHVSDDAVYALLLELGVDDLEKRLDALQAAHRFEERPLIWKAKFQLDQGRVEEAEKSIRAAIAIDPSDGEQGKGDRMRAYAVLADILDKKGDADQAKIMRGAVQAIRISENADDWWNAGLLKRAVAMYEEALTHFSDAYCIQSRLALRYSELGDFDKAEQHYLRAFQLMPDSFGRVESHCFGCEGAFRGKRAQSVAERVFTQLAEKSPEKPQVFYLLGYLRDEQREYDKAAEFYRKAVKLDPDYFNAWKKLGGVAENVRMPRAEREQIALALFRLDSDSVGQLVQVAGLRQYWDALLAASAAALPTESGPLLPLPASAAALAKDPQAQRQLDYQTSQLEQKDQAFRAQITQHPFIQASFTLLQMTGIQGW